MQRSTFHYRLLSLTTTVEFHFFAYIAYPRLINKLPETYFLLWLLQVDPILRTTGVDKGPESDNQNVKLTKHFTCAFEYILC